MEKKIHAVWFEHHPLITAKDDAPIEEFTVNGEMAPVRWFRQGTNEYNGRYATLVEYKEI